MTIGSPSRNVGTTASGQYRQPDYFMAHLDLLSDRERFAAMGPGPTGLFPTGQPGAAPQAPVATISAIWGRARGVGSEFVLATDIRFASELLGRPRATRSGDVT
jgi:enoyl-CoA hydratase/carnithine racemase